jgi:hypothetical protein
MAIDGRDIARARAAAESGQPAPRQPDKSDAFESTGVGLISHAIVWVPVVLVLGFAYVSGTWMGGWLMGVLSLVSTVATVGVVWLFLKVRKRGR